MFGACRLLPEHVYELRAMTRSMQLPTASDAVIAITLRWQTAKVVTWIEHSVNK
jgi:hypothetical protein